MATNTITITSNQTLADAIAASGIPADYSQPITFDCFGDNGVGGDNGGTGGGGGAWARFVETLAGDTSLYAVTAGVGAVSGITYDGDRQGGAGAGSNGAFGGSGGTVAEDVWTAVSTFAGGNGGAGNGVVGGGGGGAATENHAGLNGADASGVAGGAGGPDGDEIGKGGDGGSVGQVGQNATNGGGGAGALTKAGGTGTAGKVRVTYTVLESGRSTRMSLTGVGG